LGRLQRSILAKPWALDGLLTPRHDLLRQAHAACGSTRPPVLLLFLFGALGQPRLSGARWTRCCGMLNTTIFPWWQRKVVWFWDDNLTAKRFYIKDLLREMIR
jgi:hypothetical protein